MLLLINNTINTNDTYNVTKTNNLLNTIGNNCYTKKNLGTSNINNNIRPQDITITIMNIM